MTIKMNNPVAVAATKSGFSQASGDRLKASSKLPSQKKAPRSRCRLDSLGEIFEAEVLSLLKSAPGLRPAAIFEELQRRHADLNADIRRTLERRIRAWRAEHEPEQEVMFRLVHEPDKMGLSDFTEMGKRCMAIANEPLAHRLHRFRLAYSGFEHAQVVLGGETYVALAEGLQNAFWTLGGVPAEHRTDSFSAAFKNLEVSAEKELTDSMAGLCSHYGMA